MAAPDTCRGILHPHDFWFRRDFRCNAPDDMGIPSPTVLILSGRGFRAPAFICVSLPVRGKALVLVVRVFAFFLYYLQASIISKVKRTMPLSLPLCSK